MAKKQNGKIGLADPTKLKPVSKGNKIQVVIETVKGSRNKCAFDPDQRVFTLKKVLPEGMVFPHDFRLYPIYKSA